MDDFARLCAFGPILAAGLLMVVYPSATIALLYRVNAAAHRLAHGLRPEADVNDTPATRAFVRFAGLLLAVAGFLNLAGVIE